MINHYMEKEKRRMIDDDFIANKDMEKMKIYLLHKHDGENQTWFELNREELDKWMLDGSIQEGDLIIYPRRIEEVCLKKTMIKKKLNSEQKYDK